MRDCGRVHEPLTGEQHLHQEEEDDGPTAEADHGGDDQRQRRRQARLSCTAPSRCHRRTP